jgi:WD40 repeat protein
MNTHTPEPADQLDELIAAYLDAEQAGRAPERSSWLAQHPQHAAELRRFLDNHVQLARLGAPLRDLALPSPGAPGRGEPILPLGTVSYVGDYELLDEIARGGMGVVFRARQTSLGRIVALKMILAGRLASSADVQRFRAEARAVGKLDHPNILPIYEVGEHNGQHYFSMKLIEGGNLAAQLPRLLDDPRRAAEVLAAVARGVHHAHERGILHRDLKPANILLDKQGQPYVTDFGLARSAEADNRLTRTGDVLGTPAYMAPEQASGKSKQVGPTADVHALGAILYECLTGRPPFQAATTLDTVLRLLADEPVPPSRLRSGLPRDLETICLKCLQKEPRKRYASAATLAEDLTRFLDGKPVRARPVGGAERAWRWCRRNPALAAALAAVVILLLNLACGASVAAVWLKRERDTARASAARAREEERKADASARSAEASARKARQRLYAAQMHLAQKAWQDGHFLRLRELLQEQPDAADQRGFEWHYWNRLADPALLTFTGHRHVVYQIAFSPDGKRIASASWDKTIKVWDSVTGQEAFTLSGHTDAVYSVAFSPDRKHLASGSNDRTLRIWNITTGKQVRVIGGLAGTVQGVAFSPRGDLVASASGVFRKFGEVKVFDVATGQEVLSLPGHTDLAAAVVFTPDGKHIVTSGFDRTVRVWDVTNGRSVRSWWAHNSVVRGLAVSRDSKHIASSGGDTASIWEAGTGRLIRSFQGHTGSVDSVAFSPDGRYLASGGTDWTARVWDTRTGQQTFAFAGSTISLRSVAFSPDGRRLAGSDDRTVKVWDVSTRPDVQSWQAHSGGSSDVAFSADGLRLVSGGGDGWVKVWDGLSGKYLSGSRVRAAAVARVAFCPGGKELAVAYHGGAVDFLDAATGQHRRALDDHASAAFSPGGERLASLGKGRQVRVVDTARGRQIMTAAVPFGGIPMPNMSPVRCLALGPAGKVLAAGGDMATVAVWDVDTKKIIHTLRCCPPGTYVLNYAVFGLAIDAEGKRLAVGTSSGVVLVWDLTSGQQLHALRGHNATVHGLVFSPDGRRLASTGADRTVKLWDLMSGQEVLSLAGHRGAAACVTFSPGGDSLVSAGADGTVQVRTMMPADATRLNGESWSTACRPGKPLVAYRRAVRWAEAACRQQPNSGAYRNTLGVARYRAGEHAEAEAELTRSAKLNAQQRGGSDPSDLAFLALAQHRQGAKARARKTYERLQKLMKEARWANNEEAKGYLREAEEGLKEGARKKDRSPSR